jgi:hypothetical protein
MCNVCLTTFDIRDGPNDVDHDSPIVLPSIVVPQSLHSLQRLKTLYPKSFHKSTAPSSVAFKPPFTCPWLWYTPMAGLCPTSLRLTNVRHPRPDYPRKHTLWTPLHSRHLTSPPFPSLGGRTKYEQIRGLIRGKDHVRTYQKLRCPNVVCMATRHSLVTESPRPARRVAMLSPPFIGRAELQ